MADVNGNVSYGTTNESKSTSYAPEPNVYEHADEQLGTLEYGKWEWNGESDATIGTPKLHVLKRITIFDGALMHE